MHQRAEYLHQGIGPVGVEERLEEQGDRIVGPRGRKQPEAKNEDRPNDQPEKPSLSGRSSRNSIHVKFLSKRKAPHAWESI